MRRVSSAPNLNGGQYCTKSVPHSSSGDKLDKTTSQKRTKVQSVSDLVNMSAIPPLENQLVQFSLFLSTSKGVASAVCFEAESATAPAVDEGNKNMASCLSSPLMEEGDPTLELDIMDADKNTLIPLFNGAVKRPKRKNLTRWEVPSRIAKRV